MIKKVSKNISTLCVDVDGTLLELNGRYKKNEFGNPKNDVVEKLKKLKEDGVRLVISTARAKDEKQSLISHLKKFDLFDLFEDIQLGCKPIAFAYLDDRAVNVLGDDWKEQINKLMIKDALVRTSDNLIKESVMDDKLKKIANKLEGFGYFKFASKMDKIAEALLDYQLPELNQSVSAAYSVLGLDINNRENITEEEVKRIAKDKISGTHPDVVPADKKDLANTNTRILIEAMKLVSADVKKYIATGFGLGEGNDGKNLKDDYYTWIGKVDTSEVDNIFKHIFESLSKTKSRKQIVKEQGENFGEDDPEIIRLREDNKQVEMWLAGGTGTVFKTTKIIPHPRTLKDTEVEGVINIDTGIITNIRAKSWSLLNENDVKELKDKYIGTSSLRDLEKIKGQLRDRITKNNLIISKIKEKKAVEQSRGSVSQNVVVSSDRFYQDTIENMDFGSDSQLAKDKVEHILDVATSYNIIREKQRGKGIVIDVNNLNELERSKGYYEKFMYLVVQHLRRLTGKIQRNSGMEEFDFELAKKIATDLIFGEGWGKDTLEGELKNDVELNTFIKKLTVVIFSKAREYSHSIAQLLYSRGLVDEYIDKGWGLSIYQAMSMNSGELRNIDGDDLKLAIKAKEIMTYDNVGDKLKKYKAEYGSEEKQQEYAARIEEKKKKKEEDNLKWQQERDIEKQKEKEKKEKDKAAAIEKWKEKKEIISETGLQPLVITEFDNENLNKMMQYYADILSQLPAIDLDDEVMVGYMRRIRSLAQGTNGKSYFGGMILNDDLRKRFNTVMGFLNDDIVKYGGMPTGKRLEALKVIMREWKSNFDKFERAGRSWSSKKIDSIRIDVPGFAQKKNNQLLDKKEDNSGTVLDDGISGAGKIILSKYIDRYQFGGDTYKAKSIIKTNGASWYGQGKVWTTKSETVKNRIVDALKRAGYEVVER